MQFQFAFKHMDVSEALKSYAEEKLVEKIQKFVTKPIDAKVTFAVDRHKHTAHCSFHAGGGFNFEVEHCCDDMYASFDRMVDKLEKQLRKHKEILKDHRHRNVADAVELMANQAAEAQDSSGSDDELVDAGDIVKFEKSKKVSH
jgi:ribosomal subunit interface protein